MCGRCGNYVAKEPKLLAKTSIFGDIVAGREAVLKISLKNIGNLSSTAHYDFEMPEELDGKDIKSGSIEIDPGQSIDREYHLVPPKPGKYTIPAFDVVYTKSDGKEATVKIPQININVTGSPKLVASLNLSAPEFILGEEVLLLVKIANKGTAFAKNVRLQVFTPPTVISNETKTFIPTLGVNEERTAVIKLYPTFDGEHPVEVKLHYQTPPTQRGGPTNELIDLGTVKVEVRAGSVLTE